MPTKLKSTTITAVKGVRIEMDNRTRVPFKVTSFCPECSVKRVVNLSGGQHYLGYPVIGKPTDVYFCHDTKDGDSHEWQVRVVVGVTLTLAGK